MTAQAPGAAIRGSEDHGAAALAEGAAFQRVWGHIPQSGGPGGPWPSKRTDPAIPSSTRTKFGIQTHMTFARLKAKQKTTSLCVPSSERVFLGCRWAPVSGLGDAGFCAIILVSDEAFLISSRQTARPWPASPSSPTIFVSYCSPRETVRQEFGSR